MAALSLLTAFLTALPAPWLAEAWNVGGMLFIFWAFTLNLVQFIDMMVWRNSAINFAPGWCDFVVRYIYMGDIGLISASLVIARRTCLIITRKTLVTLPKDKRRDILVDLAIGLSFPIYFVSIYWFIQGHRFDIYEGVGCYWAIPASILAICLTSIWPIIIGLVSASYCCRTLWTIWKYRREVESLLSSHKLITSTRYYRLVALCSTEIICTIPLGSFYLWRNATILYYPWHGFADLHSGFGRVTQFPLGLWVTDPVWVELQLWPSIVMGLIFFGLFGLSREAITNYYSAGRWVARIIGIPCRDRVEPDNDSIVFAHTSQVVIPNVGISDTFSSSLTVRDTKTDILPPGKIHLHSSSFADELGVLQEVEVENRFPHSMDEERGISGPE